MFLIHSLYSLCGAVRYWHTFHTHDPYYILGETIFIIFLKWEISFCICNALTLENSVSTLGSETSGGSLHIVKLTKPLDLNSSISSISQRIHEVATFNRTIWTADYNFNRSQAVIGKSLSLSLSLSLNERLILNLALHSLLLGPKFICPKL